MVHTIHKNLFNPFSKLSILFYTGDTVNFKFQPKFYALSLTVSFFERISDLSYTLKTENAF